MDVCPCSIAKIYSTMGVQKAGNMNLIQIENNGVFCAVMESDNTVITHAQSAIDLLISVKLE